MKYLIEEVLAVPCSFVVLLWAVLVMEMVLGASMLQRTVLEFLRKYEKKNGKQSVIV